MARTPNLLLLATLIRQESESVLRNWRVLVRQMNIARHLDVPTLNDHIPDLLEELAQSLEGVSSDSMIEELRDNPVEHGLDRLKLGFDVEEVVGEYNALREVLHELLEANHISLEGSVNRRINRVIDKSIGLAVKTYATQRALEAQQRRQEYISFVAHDLRTPLSAISMATQLLQQHFGSEGGSEAQFLFDTLHRNGARLNALVLKVVHEEENLKSLACQAKERCQVLAHPVVQACLDDLQPLSLFSGTSLLNQVAPELTCYANASSLSQVFLNLISNALAYSPKGEVRVGGRDLPGFSEFWVSDTDCGIPADRLEHIFDKMETDPDPQRKGMGLGLAIVKQFVEAQGGRVTVQSQLGQGTTFTFTIAQDPSSSIAPRPNSST